MTEIVIIGAGIAGLTCADRLRKQGIACTLIEKSSGLGGRVATRRMQGTWLDHGLPYLQTGKNDRFNQWVRELLANQVIEYWTETAFCLSPKGLSMPPGDPSSVYFAAPAGMTDIAKFMARGQTILLKTRVGQISCADDRWAIAMEGGESFPADILVMTPPAPQALSLLESVLSQTNPALLKPLQSIEFNPCVSLMAGYNQSRSVPIDWEIIDCTDNLVLERLLFNSTKQRHPTTTTLVLHSTSTFAQTAFATDDLEPIGKQMLQELGKILLPSLATPDWWQVHRWRFARSVQPLALTCLSTTNPLPLIFAGDWLMGGGIEGAYLSGLAAAETILESLEQ